VGMDITRVWNEYMTRSVMRTRRDSVDAIQKRAALKAAAVIVVCETEL
jgi:hypothetical protein